MKEDTGYDSISEVYIAHAERPDSWNNLYERPSMIARLPALEGKHVLDIGCGAGFYTEYALKQGADVTALDASQSLLDKISQRNSSARLKTLCADLSLPLTMIQPDSFDYVIGSLVIHYIKDWTALFKEIYRVMKKGGLFFISIHHPYLVLDYPLLKGTNYFDTVLVEDVWGRKNNPFKVHYYTRSLNDTLKPVIESQFKIISIDEPKPDEKNKQTNPELYNRLSERPGFLFITLGK
jgi:SAM-dependent methyltransferase